MQNDEKTPLFPLEQPFNPFDPATYVNLHERLAYLRESEPVYWLPELQIWCVSRFDDVAYVFSNENFIKRGWRRLVETTFGEDSGIGDFLFFTDPPDHARLRSLVSKAFVPRVVERLRAHTEDVCNTLLADARQMGRCDLVSDYAWRIPMAVIAPLFDLPSTDHRLLEKWGRDLFLGEDSTRPEFLAAGKAALKDMYAYFAALVKEHRTHPTGVFLDDLIAAQEQGDSLNPHELVMMAIQLVTAGYDTSANQIANGIHCLLTYRENWELLCADSSLLGQAVEEIMRYEPVALLLLREAVKDVTLHGKTVHAGDLVGLLIPAANRDPRRFEQPERFDITRTKTPNLSFGRGIHTCLGAPLARLEIALAIRAVTQNFPRLELEETIPAWQPSFLFRGLERLPVALHN
jgi:cytochrome P450